MLTILENYMCLSCSMTKATKCPILILSMVLEVSAWHQMGEMINTQANYAQNSLYRYASQT